MGLIAEGNLDKISEKRRSTSSGPSAVNAMRDSKGGGGSAARMGSGYMSRPSRSGSWRGGRGGGEAQSVAAPEWNQTLDRIPVLSRQLQQLHVRVSRVREAGAYTRSHFSST